MLPGTEAGAAPAPPAILRVHNRQLFWGKTSFPCAIGRGGLIAAEDKREGDGCTPLGRWHLRECFYRADRISPPTTGLPLHIIQPDDGWCDDPPHPLYNRRVTLPFPARHERLWRDDGLYDLIIPLGYNDNPTVPGKGSAIFLHVASEDYAPTEGCVALARADVLSLLPGLTPQSAIDIS